MKKQLVTLLAAVFCLGLILTPTRGLAAPKLEAPTFMVARQSQGSTSAFQAAPGSLSDSMGIRIYMTHPNSKAQIYFTTDGSTPTKSSDTWNNEYDSPLDVNRDVVFKAIVYADGYDPSDVATFTFTLVKGKANTWELVNTGSGQKWRYYDGNGQAVHSGWIKDKGKWYFFEAPYNLVMNGWNLCPDGKWYYFSASGAMKTGWVKDGGKWYYLTPSGAMKTGWLNDGGVWYYLYGNGSMATGWLQRPEGWYYLLPSGKMVTNGREMGDIHQVFDPFSGLWTGVAG